MRQSLLVLLVFMASIGTLHAGTVAPEIDASNIGSALALVIGGYLVVVSKYRRK